MNEPLLDAQDFARLLHGGACFHLARRHGIPPDVMIAHGHEELRWRDFPFGGDCRAFEREVLAFFGLSGGDAFLPDEALIDTGARLQARWRHESGAVVFHTSGSTGTPVPWRHSTAMLRQEAEAVRPLCAGAARVVCTTPPFHSYGFVFGFLLPRLSGMEAVLLPSLPTFLAGELRPGDLLVSFPLLLGKILEPPPSSARCLCSTAPCPPGLFPRLESLGFAGMTEIYGSSETGAVATRTAEDEPFTLLPHWRKGGETVILRSSPEGESGSASPLPDHVAWHGIDRLDLAGRIDQAVQIAGVNVYPEKIAARLRTHPLVRECAVRPMRPDEGSRLKAFIVAEGGLEPSMVRRSLKAYIREALGTAERPARLSFGSSLPRTDAGKLCDWE